MLNSQIIRVFSNSSALAGSRGLLDPELALDEVYRVQFFPAEELDFFFGGLAVLEDGDLLDIRVAAEMAVCGGGGVDGVL